MGSSQYLATKYISILATNVDNYKAKHSCLFYNQLNLRKLQPNCPEIFKAVTDNILNLYFLNVTK